MAEGDTFVNALIGAVAVIVAGSFLPFGPVFGGGVAGYLHGGSREDGLKVGAFAGLLALIPLFLLFLLVGSILFGAVVGAPQLGIPAAASGIGFLVLLFVFVFAMVYVVGLSALGGWLGNYVKYETDVDV